MAHSTRRAKRKKPRPDFPLFPHATGYWAKKSRGKLRTFGDVANDAKGGAAIKLWAEQKDELLAGRTPRISLDRLTAASLCNHFLTAKEQQRDAVEIRSPTIADYFAPCSLVVKAFDKTCLVDDLADDDFQSLRAKLAKRFGPHALSFVSVLSVSPWLVPSAEVVLTCS